MLKKFLFYLTIDPLASSDEFFVVGRVNEIRLTTNSSDEANRYHPQHDT